MRKNESRCPGLEAELVADPVVRAQAEAWVDEPIRTLSVRYHRIAGGIGFTMPQRRVDTRKNRGVLYLVQGFDVQFGVPDREGPRQIVERHLGVLHGVVHRQ